jgi:hypothetical protein
MKDTAVVRVTGQRRALRRVPRTRPFSAGARPRRRSYTEHHGAGGLEYRFALDKGLPFPSFIAASAEFPELRVEAGVGQGGRARRGGDRERTAGGEMDRRQEHCLKPEQRYVQCASPRGLHRIAYLEWGDAKNDKVLVCVHGLGRCARDFDALAAAMSGEYRVVCPDVAGRGDSAWLADPMLYQLPQYVSDMVTLIARLDVETVHWVGTSMGALIGMALAGLPDTPAAQAGGERRGPCHFQGFAGAHRRLLRQGADLSRTWISPKSTCARSTRLSGRTRRRSGVSLPRS